MPQGVLLYTKPQMAAAMQVCVRCVTGMMARGEISYFKIHGRNVRFLPVAALRRLIETSLLVEGADAAEAMADGRWLKAEHLFPARFCRDGNTSSDSQPPSPQSGEGNDSLRRVAEGDPRVAGATPKNTSPGVRPSPHPACGRLLPSDGRRASPQNGEGKELSAVSISRRTITTRR
jgi:hypothetical protein